MRDSSGSVLIRRSELSDAYSLRESLNEVASEKWTLATVDGFSIDETRAFLKRVTEGRLPQVLAIVDGKVIGWCDIIPRSAKGTSHVATVGMGVRKEWRQRGVGRRLLKECLALARAANLEKVELEVFSDNIPAVRLYQSVGFRKEGLRVRARKLEGRCQDVVLMAYWLDRSDGTQPDAAAVLFTVDLARMARFYETVAGLHAVSAEDDHVVLENGSFRLVVHQIPAQYAEHTRIDDPPSVREAGAVKLSFPVVSIADAREAATRFGGRVYPAGREWSFGSATMCDGWDPDGNVFQLSQPKPAVSS